MESDQQNYTLGQWMSPYAYSIPVDSSSTLFPRYIALTDHSPPINGQISSNHPKSVGLSIEIERSPCNSISDDMQLLPSPCSDHSTDINARFAHDPTAPISTNSRDSYSVIQGQFCNAPWRRAGELEPKDPNTGRSVLYALLEEHASGNKGSTKCRLCNLVFSRADRAITHLRHKHLDHRPFRCGGTCGTNGCSQRFHSQENLAPHVKPKIAMCHYCEHKCLRQNIKRHIDRYHRKQPEISPHMTAFTPDLS